LIRQGAKQADCFEVVAEGTSKSLLWGAISFNTKVAKLGTLAIERRKEITEAIQHSKRSLASSEPFRLTGIHTTRSQFAAGDSQER
jgi:hypothetical protein